jgi:hypothetical protein
MRDIPQQMKTNEYSLCLLGQIFDSYLAQYAYLVGLPAFRRAFDQ